MSFNLKKNKSKGLKEKLMTSNSYNITFSQLKVLKVMKKDKLCPNYKGKMMNFKPNLKVFFLSIFRNQTGIKPVVKKETRRFPKQTNQSHIRAER